MENVNALVTECQEALASCPHAGGTVSVMCHVCLEATVIMAWDVHDGNVRLLDCPRHHDDNNNVLEVCPCLEKFNKETILRAIKGRHQCYPLLSEAVNWMRLGAYPAESGALIKGAAATDLRQKLHVWANEHREIRIPHPKAALILHLLDHDMIEFEDVPGTGVVLRARGAKEEFCRFITNLNRSYKHEGLTRSELLCFAYRACSWKFDPADLLDYVRGTNGVEIDSEGCALDPRMQGDEADISELIRKAYGC